MDMGQDQDTSYGDIFECAHHLSSVFFAGVQTADQFAYWCFVRRRLSWGAHVGQAEAAHCPLGAKRAGKKWKVPHKLYEKGWKHSRCEGTRLRRRLREEAEEWLLEGRLFPGHKV